MRVRSAASTASFQSDKCTVVDDTCLYTPTEATKQHIDHMSKSLNVMIGKLKQKGKMGEDKSSKKVVVENVARISRVGQQAILKALAID